MSDWDFQPPPESELGDRDIALESTYLQNKRIALLVTGSIAAMKAPLIARTLRRQGADVVAFASAEALRYTTIDALEWSTTNGVITKLTANAEHLSDNNPFAVYLAAPATYNTINKMGLGIADGVITSTLASAIGRMERGKTKILIAPTMHGSLHNSILTQSLKQLDSMGVTIVPPQVANGKNNLPDEQAIAFSVCRAVSTSSLKDIPILVTGGPTPVPIDNIRRLTNRFTGRLGACIAQELYLRSAKVRLIHGQGSYIPPKYLPHKIVTTYDEYLQEVMKELQNDYRYGIFSAAVADYKPIQVFQGKIPSNGALSQINLTSTQKVIREVKAKFPSLGMITFKYQENISHEELIEIANQRLQQGYQMVVANRGEEHQETGAQVAYLVTKEDKPKKVIGKQTIARAIANYLEVINNQRSLKIL
ncbi:bifunctional phosphopantothenoylcysteine decarboxylase/phosphopantothenate--cysteine ligase CoaBC [Waterburya agarophytonicola K14]|uniref:Coenzyme A biosynthesis bifunctional protein CoaBC n=1 Tax=Waterburya agarophytonicola KI4 TaxID=2874699 RepID=A0A964FH57_9CYAN|nr:bifunctional phosphopantothenoylcysteine decarboxylase/phosphopantothenate--cysteine ligase CoaBC [Waterburya agarophytonicola KI4]